MKKQKGISLIVLIITIVVIIILATAIIVNLAQTNIINNAKAAVVKQDISTFQDELNMYIADKYADTLGKFDAKTLNATDKEEIAQIIPSIKGTKYEEYVVIENGKIAISETMPEPDKTWAMEELGLTNTTTNTPTEPEEPAIPDEPETPTEPEEPTTPVVSVNTKVETANSTITGSDFAYNNPVIPVGFKAINTTDATWSDIDNDGVVDGWNNGLVIQDASENEFVWVPVDGTNITYAKNFAYPSYYDATAENTSDDTEALPTVNGTTIDENAQITKYGGFYIGRYEVGVPANQTTITGESSSSNTTGIPTVKQGAKVWTYINYTNANANALSFCNTDNVKSGLVTGTQWDTVMKWIENAGISVTDSTTWGNYSDSASPANVTGYGTKQTAGYSEYWKAKNIYDLGGNTWEWTGEIYSSNRIYRGGSYYDSGSNNPASYRNSNYNASDTNGGISFRLSLYVM